MTHVMIVHPPAPIAPEQAALHRMHDAVQAGQHPLATVTGQPLPLHPDAAPALDMTAPGLRCSSCYWNTLAPAGRAGRCRRLDSDPPPDLRPWFPACADYEPPDYEPPEPEAPDAEP